MPHLKLRDGAELYYEKHGNGPPLFLVPGPGRRRPMVGRRMWPSSRANSPWSCTIIAAPAAARCRRSTYSVDADGRRRAAADRRRWASTRSTGAAIRPAARWARCWRSSIPARIDRLVLSATWAKTDAFFRRLFEVRARTLRELGPAAYQKSSALALNSPCWVRDHDADLAAAGGQGQRDHPGARDRAVAHRRDHRARPARPAADGEGADPGDLSPATTW